MKKKFLVLILSLAMVMSMTACGGSDADTSASSAPASDNADETQPADEETDETKPVDEETDETEAADENGDVGELVYNEANGLKIGLPAGFAAADGGVEGMTIFADTTKDAFVTVTGPLSDDTTKPDMLTEEAFATMFEQGGYKNAVVDNVGTVEQPDGATTVTAFGTGTMPQDDGDMDVNIVMQYYFIADGSGAYIVNYVYPLEDTATDNVIADILATVTVE